MAKEISAKVKLQCPGGQATPAPPVGPALGAHGVNIAAFVKEFNEKTREAKGMIIPVEITIFKDRTFELLLKSPPASVLLIKAAGVDKGAGEVGKVTVGKVTKKQVEEIIKIKRKDLNANTDEAAFRMIAGTARNMGIEIVD